MSKTPTSKKKIYISITPYFPSPNNWRGAYVYDQVRAIERRSDFRVMVFMPCPLFSKQADYEFQGIRVYRVPSLFMPSYFFNGLGGNINGTYFLSKLKELSIDLDDVEVVHCHTAAFACYATAVKKVASHVKTVLQYHCLDPYQLRLGKFATWWPNITFRAKCFISQFKNIDLHLCISQKVEYNLRHFPAPADDECYKPYLATLKAAAHIKTPKNLKTYVLYNGVDTDVFKPSLNAKRETDVFRIGCIANFQDLKDHMTLIRAIELLVSRKSVEKKIMVSFIGSGATKDQCVRYIEQNGLSEHFLFEKEVHHGELPAYYQSLDLFVLPSYFEGLGCVYLEAAACGVPFMGCTGQGYSEFVCDCEKDLWLIEPGDSAKLSQLIERQILQPKKQTLANDIDIDSLIQKYLEHLCDDK